MTLSTVYVKNITPSTTETELSNFFSFCGKISQVSLTPASGDANAPLSASITFERESAAKTATLLDGTPFKDLPLQVEAAHNIDEIAGDHLAPSADVGPDGEIPQEAKPKSAVLAEYLANGYVIGEDALQKGIELDKKHQLTSKFASYLTNVVATIDSKVHATDRARAADTQYKLSEKAANATTGLSRYFEKALGTAPGQRIRRFYETSEKQVLDIHNEARRLAELKKEKRRRSQELGPTADGKPFVTPDGASTTESGSVPAQKEAEDKAGPAGQLQHAFEDIKGADQGAKAV